MSRAVEVMQLNRQAELELTPSQTLANFAKIIRRLTHAIKEIQKVSVGKDIPVEAPPLRGATRGANGAQSNGFVALEQTIEEDLSEEAAKTRALQRELLGEVDMAQFAIDPTADFTSAEAQVQAIAAAPSEDRVRMSTTVSVKGTAVAPVADGEGKKEKRREKGDDGRKKHKKPRRD